MFLYGTFPFLVSLTYKASIMNSLLNRLNILLLKYRQGNIESSEFSELQKGIDETSDIDFRVIIEKQWDEFEKSKLLTEDKKHQLMENIQKSITVPSCYSLKSTWISVAAAIVLIVLTNVTVFLLTKDYQVKEIAAQKIEINAGELDKSEVLLSDGSLVKLNRNSKLSYAHDFNTTKRIVELEGEGYFKVKKDPEKEFIVKTEYVNVCVLGTTFNVHSYEDEDLVETTLVEGKIKLTTNQPPYESIILLPKEKVVYNKTTGKLKLVKTEDVLETSWTNEQLIFRDTPIRDVIKRLERKFEVKFVFKDRRALDDLYTGKFDNDNLESIMQILQWHYRFDYIIETKQDKKFVIIK